MNCDDIDNAIYVYLDGEFAAPESADFEAHLKGCARCRATVKGEAAFIASIRDAATRVPAPAGLRERIGAALADAPAPEQRSQRRRSPWVPALVAVAAAALVVVLAGGFGTGATDAGSGVVDEAVATHQKDLPMEVRGSEHQIRRFLQDNVPFAVEIPINPDNARVQLVGARLTRVQGREAVLFNYEVDGDRLTVIQVADGGDANDLEPTFGDRAGFKVGTFRRSGVTSSFVGNNASGQVRRLIRASYQR